MNKQALEFVMEFYKVDRVTALQIYWDEIKAAEQIFDCGLFTEDSKDAEV
jgi:hypothetical protein